MNPSRLSKPVIAGITVGGIVACTLVILIILKLTGFFEPEKDVADKKGDSKVKLSESVQKGIKLMQDGKDEDRKLLKKWAKDELPGILEKEPVAFESLLDTFSASIASLLEKGKVCKEDNEALKKVIVFLESYSGVCDQLLADFCKSIGFEKDMLEKKSVEEIINALKDKDSKTLEVGKKVFKVLRDGITLQLLDAGLKESWRLFITPSLAKTDQILNHFEANS